tara:strand:- start:1373 stop:2293 length:921 start_codon:yes stop_codon:yes gene_type:complete
MINKFIILFILFFHFAYASSGGYVGSSYRYGSNARQIALSNSTLAFYNKGYNPLTNPALLGSIKEMEYGFSYFDMSLDRYIQTFSITIPAPPAASIGLSAYILGTDNIAGISSDNVSTGLYSAWEGYGMLSFGVDMGRFSPGVNIKLFQSKIASYTADGVGLDVAFLYKISSNIQLALMLENIYAKYSWDINTGESSISYDEKFPQIISLGLSNKINSKILFLYQTDYESEFKNSIHKIGLELDPNDIYTLRLGINNKNNVFNYSFGFGTNIYKTKNNLNIGLDYAMDTGKFDEGMSHLFTFTFFK